MSELWDMPLVRMFVILLAVAVAELLWRFGQERFKNTEETSSCQNDNLKNHNMLSLGFNMGAKLKPDDDDGEHYHPLNLPPKGPDPKQSVVFRSQAY